MNEGGSECMLRDTNIRYAWMWNCLPARKSLPNRKPSTGDTLTDSIPDQTEGDNSEEGEEGRGRGVERDMEG
ncbi:hypothetical protein E2C01_019101 [Portunus trituberculatus]|uniref:Uncharacterized protein n=1 Tax=Portunus trituberculatus TaxID=210409 RepID=A0A5B7DXC7_PORTR|nr:hypothetical protein [Portunus trituberculatus]